MKRFWLIALMLIVGVLVSACGNNAPLSTSMIEVDLTFQPETAKAGEPVTFQAKVTQDDKAVDDADEVIFEIRKEGADESQQIEAEHKKGGIYYLEMTIDEAGNYYVTSHVTARSMHNMPTEVLTVE